MCVGKEAVAKLAALALIFACSPNPARDASTGTGIDAAVADGKRFANFDGGADGPRDVSAAAIDARLAEAGVSRDLPAATDARDGPRADGARDGTKASDGQDSAAIDGGFDVGRDSAAIDARNDAADGPIVSIDVALPRPGTCANPIPIPLRAMHTDMQATNVGAEHLVDIPCAENGADVVFSVSVEDLEIVYADTFGASWDTILLFSETCPPDGNAGDVTSGLDSCNDDACGTAQSQAMALVGYGTHYLILSGGHGETGAATIHFDRTVVGGGMLLPMEAGTGSISGVTAGQSLSDLCEAGGPEDTYWWTTCPDFAGGSFFASTCGGTSYDTVLALQVPRSGVVACNDDDNMCGRQSTVTMALPPGAGLQSLLIDGHVGTSAGAYTLAYTRP
jgi:hypothetical protein